MTVREQAIEVIKNNPPDISWDDLISEMMMMKSVERSWEQAKNGQVLTEEEMDAEIESWD